MYQFKFYKSFYQSYLDKTILIIKINDSGQYAKILFYENLRISIVEI